MSEKKCPSGTRRNKKTGECERTKKEPSSKSKSKEEEKKKNCPRGTRRNKKTGECERTKRPKEITPDWDKNTKTFVKTHNGRNFTFMEIPENTSIYRGFQHGHKSDIGKNNKYNVEAAQKAKTKGLYYGTLAIACYYARYLEDGQRLTYEVMEFKPKHNLIILDMSVWENLKNIADDCGKGTEFDGKDKDKVLEFTHKFFKNEPEKKIERQSNRYIDEKMTKLMMDWMKLDTSPEMDGFGHSMMPGFHSELMCVSREKSLDLVNVYSTNDYFSHDLVNEKIKTDVIHMDGLEFMANGNNKPFQIKKILPEERFK